MAKQEDLLVKFILLKLCEKVEDVCPKIHQYVKGKITKDDVDKLVRKYVSSDAEADRILNEITNEAEALFNIDK